MSASLKTLCGALLSKVLYWIELYGGTLGYRDVWETSFVTWCVILLEGAIRRWVHCGHEG